MWQTYIYYHFTALAGSNLAEQLQDEGLCHIPGQIPNISLKNKHILVMEWETAEKRVIFLLRHLLGLFILGINTTQKTATQKYLVEFPHSYWERSFRAKSEERTIGDHILYTITAGDTWKLRQKWLEVGC